MTGEVSPDTGTPSVLPQPARLPFGARLWPAVSLPWPQERVEEAFAPLRDADPGWELALLVDDHPTMVVWRETVAEFAERAASFLRVRTGTGLTGAPPPPEDGRPAMLLVLTDGAAPAWRDSAIGERLRRWSGRRAVAVVHMLSQPMWHHTAVAGKAVTLCARSPGGVNGDWEADPAGPPARVAVPVLQFDPGWLRAWSRLCAGPEAPIGMSVLLEATETAPAPERYASFLSAEALKLAGLLAAAPLSVPVMRLVQARHMPHSLPEHLAELLVGGLVRPVAPDPSADASGLITHEFARGLRKELLAVARRSAILRVVRTLDEYLGGDVPAIRRMRDSVDRPGRELEEPGPGERWIAEIQAAVLQTRSGPGAASGRRLEESIHGSQDVHGGVPRPGAQSGEGGMSTSQETAQPIGGAVGAVTVEPGAAMANVPKIWGSIPQRNPNFTGRAELLRELKERLEGGMTAVLPEALHGMGGVGKTQVVVEYVYRNASDYDVVWWIPAERPAQIANAMVDLATRLNLLSAQTEAAVAIPAVREALRIGRPYPKWLLVFDNADSPETVRRYFPMGGPGHILVTSRNPQWASVARAVEVDVFERDESKQLLQRRAPHLSGEQADELAKVLGDLPLAIEQAAAWLAATGMPAVEYLNLFQAKRTEFQEKQRIELMELSPPVDYQLPVAAAWNVSLDHLARSRPASLRLLQLCAFLAPEPISRVLLSGKQMRIWPELDAAMRDPIQLGRAIGEINRYALARIDHAKNTIQMHRLVQVVLRERMNDEERAIMRRGAHLLLAANDPGQPEDRSVWPRYAELYPHLVASDAIDDAIGEEERWVRGLVINIAKYHAYWGNQQESLEVCEQAYAAWRDKLGPEEGQTIQIGHWLSFILFKLGRYEEAARLNAELLETCLRVFGPEHEETLDAMQAVASDRRVQGRFKESLEMSRTVYDRYLRLSGDGDPQTLNAAHNLAVTLRLSGDFEQAHRVDTATWERKIQVFGQNHEETLRALRGILIDRRQLGDYLTSRDEFERLATVFAEVFGDRDPQTLETNRSLSVTRRKAGDHAGALAISQDALRRYVKAFGEDNPDTMSAALNLSLDLRQNGQLERAEEIAADNFDRFRRTLGEAHPHALAAAGNLAIILRLKGDLTGARELNEATLRRLRDNLPATHVLTLGCATNLASDLYESGEAAPALELDTANLELYRSALGERHPSTLAGALNLAIDLRGLDREQEAFRLHTETVGHYKETLGAHHPATHGAAHWERAHCDMDPMPL
jgi:tetratricopeptide (TPR) repeat protein